MVTPRSQFDNLRELKQYIYETLCNHCQLQIGAFPMTKRVLSRGGKPCGIYFCVHGPRATKFTAIWEMERNRILFYDCDGERFLKTDLSEAPRPAVAVA